MLRLERKLLFAFVAFAFVVFPNAAAQDVQLCFETVSDIPGIYLQEHPAGGKLAVATQDGVIKLTSIPPVGSEQQADVISSYLDISSRVRDNNEQGLLSFAFHPNFLSNGRFFVSYICDAGKHSDCQGTCAVAAIKSDAWCPYNTIVAEYSALPDASSSTSLNSTEVRKILRFGRPYENHNGGHIWFGSDGLLYYTSGDGGSQGDPMSTAQNLQVPLGKVLRLDVDGALQDTQWGTYSVPQDNPFVGQDSAMGEIYALGLRNPWRCFEDRTSDVTLCGDVGADAMEEVDVLLKGHNYGWSYFEGTNDGPHSDPPSDPPGGSFTEPVLEYAHPEVENGIAIIGGIVYRANRNPCLQGKYIYGDEFGLLYAGSVYQNGSTAPLETGVNSDATYSVADAFPATSSKASTFDTNKLFSWGMDSSNELYRLSSIGIHRVTNSSFCGFTCNGIAQVTAPSAPVALPSPQLSPPPNPLPHSPPPGSPPPPASPPPSPPPNPPPPPPNPRPPPRTPAPEQASPPPQAPAPSAASPPPPSQPAPPPPSASPSSLLNAMQVWQRFFGSSLLVLALTCLAG